MVDDVHLGSQEHVRGIGEIGKAIAQMEHVTQTTAADAEEGCCGSRRVKRAQAETMKSIAERLTAMVGGGDTSNSYGRQTHRPRAKASASLQQRKAETGLAALRKAVSDSAREKGAPVHLAYGSPNDAFRRKERFKEF